MHTALLSGREWLYDHIGAPSIFDPGDKLDRFGKITITLQPGGGVNFEEDDPRWAPEEVREIAEPLSVSIGAPHSGNQSAHFRIVRRKKLQARQLHSRR